jgi:hypothetical protein
LNNENILSQINTIRKFTTTHSLIKEKFTIEIFSKKKRIELTLGDKVCFVSPSSDLVCDTIVRGRLSKRFGGLESPSVYVLVSDNKFDFYNIINIAKAKCKNLDTVLK